jgi:Tol biopolymer transport system component
MKILKVFTILILILFLSKGITEADFTFGEPVNLGPMVNSQSGEYSATYSTDGLEIFFTSNRSHPGVVTMEYFDIYVTKRAHADAPWSPAVNLGPVVNSTLADEHPFLTSDGLTLYFGSYRSEIWFSDLWMTTRASKDDDWGPPVNLGFPVNSQGDTDEDPSLTSDGLELYFASDRTGPNWQYNLWVTKRESINDPWSQPVNLGPTVNGGYSNDSPAISSDGLVLIFNRGHTLWITKRASRTGNWCQPEKLESTVNFMNVNLNPDISPDGRWLLWSSANYYTEVDMYDVWQAPILPVVDFNGDGIVDATDVCIIVDNWGTDNSLCDIGPMPWGDGVVDVQDLIVLAEHLFEETSVAE